MLNHLVGNLGAALLFNFSIDTVTVFAVLSGIGALGVFLFLALREVSPPQSRESEKLRYSMKKVPRILEVRLWFLSYERGMLDFDSNSDLGALSNGRQKSRHDSWNTDIFRALPIILLWCLPPVY